MREEHLQEIMVNFLGEMPEEDDKNEIIENVIRVMRRFAMCQFRFEKTETGVVHIATNPRLRTQKDQALFGNCVRAIFSGRDLDGFDISLPAEFVEALDSDGSEFEVR